MPISPERQSLLDVARRLGDLQSEFSLSPVGDVGALERAFAGLIEETRNTVAIVQALAVKADR